MLGTRRSYSGQFIFQQRIVPSVVLVACSCWLASPVAGQQVTVGTPMIGVQDSFYEHINLGWGMYQSNPHQSWFLNFGSPMGAVPPFGGYNPASELRFGFGRSGPGSGFHFNMAASQGSNRTLTMTSPSVTMMNGVPGSIFSGSIRPFVTGLIPVVGDYPIMVPYAPYPYPYGIPYSGGYPYSGFVAPNFAAPVSPVMERLERLRHEPPPVPPRVTDDGRAEAEAADSLVLGDEAASPAPMASSSHSSSAERGDISVAEIRRLQALEDEAKRLELRRLIQEAEAAERSGQLAVARVRYQQAATRATGEQRQFLLESVAKLKRQRP